mmetsp:Transcript_60643/g.179831  ORF Transcript_60643/g.179831 Transcript_60643/m.179831 type:complete len:123 (+) Transcript_60643:3618-3986(+)
MGRRKSLPIDAQWGKHLAPVLPILWSPLTHALGGISERIRRRSSDGIGTAQCERLQAERAGLASASIPRTPFSTEHLVQRYGPRLNNNNKQQLQQLCKNQFLLLSRFANGRTEIKLTEGPEP